MLILNLFLDRGWGYADPNTLVSCGVILFRSKFLNNIIKIYEIILFIKVHKDSHILRYSNSFRSTLSVLISQL